MVSTPASVLTLYLAKPVPVYSSRSNDDNIVEHSLMVSTPASVLTLYLAKPSSPCYISNVNQRFLLLLAGDIEANPGPLPWTWKKLDEVSSTEIDKILSEFGMITKNDASIKVKTNVLQCSIIYHKHFSKYNLNQILAGFTKKGNLMELRSDDEAVKFGEQGICQEQFPCAICAKEVKDSDQGLRCEGCFENFHNQCADTPMSKQLYEQLIKSTPDFVKVFCPKCMESIGVYKQRIDYIAEELAEVKATVNRIQEKADLPPVRNGTYADTLESNMNAIGLQQRKSNEMVKVLLNKSKQTAKPEDIEKQERTCIVRKPKDPNVRDSRDIRKEINKKFPDVIIKKARNTAGGSILIEFEDAGTANNIIEDWDENLFGGNTGIVKHKPQHTAGIVKEVEELDENEIKEEKIMAQFPDSHIELFKREDRFTGTIKIIFKNEETLNNARQEKCRINGQIYIVEVFNPKPKVIKCHICQKFGHVSRVCRSKDNPVCGKCSGKHDTRNCNIPKEQYKCVHCDGNHITGSYTCEKVKQKLEELLNRANGN